MRKGVKYLIVTGAALLLSVVCALVSLVSIPAQRLYTAPEDVVSRMGEARLTWVDCVLEHGVITPTGDDPQILIDGVEGAFSTLCIRLAGPMRPGTDYQLYYAVNGGGFREAQSVTGRSVAGQTELVFPLPGADCTCFRLDVDGAYELEDILSSQSPAGTEVADNVSLMLAGDFSRFNGLQWLISFVVFWAEGMLLLVQYRRILAWCREKWALYHSNVRRFWLGVLLCAGAVGAAFILWGILCAAGVLTACGYSAAYFAFAGLALGSVIALRRQAEGHPERLWALLILCAGLMLTAQLPRYSNVSWDDQIHYRRALQMSYGYDSWLTQADIRVMEAEMTYEPGLDQARALEEQFCEGYRAGAVEHAGGGSLGMYTVAYLPAAAGLWLGRALGLSFTGIFTAGRIANLLCFTAVMYFAMKRLRGGCALLGAFTLVPTVIFLFGNYSYDSWCISFLALGTAIFLDEYCHPERPLGWKTAASMLVCLMLGCAPKAIYFPIFLVGLFMPRQKFETKKQLRIYRWAVVLCAAAMALSFAAPFLFTGGSNSSDLRGGSDVSASGQLAHILSNPLGYVIVLLRFFATEYFNPSRMVENLVVFQAYMPAVRFGLVFVVLVVLAFLAQRPREEQLELRPGTAVRAAAFLSFFCAVSLAATALYVSFTAVGAPTIEGCSHRYMLPVLLPLLMLWKPRRSWLPVPGKYSQLGLITAEGVVVFACYWPLMASYV